MLTNLKVRYMLAGAWNTLFGYFSALVIYDFLRITLHIILIGIIINILNISMSFFTYKLFVFQTKKNWVKEYLRSYIVYGFTALISLCMLWFFVDYLNVRFWIAQALILLIGIFISFKGHHIFTFKA